MSKHQDIPLSKYYCKERIATDSLIYATSALLLSTVRARQDAAAGYSGGSAELDVAREKAHDHGNLGGERSDAANKTFSLARFVPLLAERMYVLSPFTRNYLVSWVAVLDSVPDLELVSFLPNFLDGLLKYLSDPNTDVRLATANVLAEFLREIREAAETSVAREEHGRRVERTVPPRDPTYGVDDPAEGSNVPHTASSPGSPVNPSKQLEGNIGAAHDGDEDEYQEEVWIPGREVRIDYAEIMEVLINHIAFPDEEIQATTLQWIAELLRVVKHVVIPFTPRLIPAILPNLAHHSPAIQMAANETNVSLYNVIQDLPAPAASTEARPPSEASQADTASVKTGKSPSNAASKVPPGAGSPHSSPHLRSSSLDSRSRASGGREAQHGSEPFDYQVAVNMLTLQLLDQHEETRVSSLEWLIMLHSKAPQRILTMQDGTFPALLKTLSDPAEEVIRCDLRLLAQISSASEDTYFSSFMANLLSLFSTDRRLLEVRGSLIIRQLCASLHTERIFRTLSELLEKDEDLEFASIMVQNLNLILVTSPELADFRRRLKNIDSKDGQHLFVTLYRSWCHNSVATFTLCLLAQAYEHASNLLQILADLEMTVAMLIQVDKLVQLLESPIFTSLRLQLLEPDKNPFLLKAMYGILMLLPQSSAFATLRNRLSAVSNMGAGTRSTYAQTARTNMPGRDGIKWSELLTHFRNLQNRHERSRKSTVSNTPESLVPGMAATQVNKPLTSPASAGMPSARRLASATSSLSGTPRRRPTNSSANGLSIAANTASVMPSRFATAGDSHGRTTPPPSGAAKTANQQAQGPAGSTAPPSLSSLGISSAGRPLSPSSLARAKTSGVGSSSRIASGKGPR